MEFVEKWGTDVDTAVDLALDELKTTRDKVDIEILEEPSRGFFGIGSKLALVRVKMKQEPKKSESKKAVQKKSEKNNRKSSIKDIDKTEDKSHFTNEILQDDNKINDGVDNTKKEEKSQINKDTSSLDTILADKVPYPEENIAVPFLKDVTEKMGIELEFTPYKANDYLFIDISGKDTGTIIGKRGQTLDSIQYLTNLVLNKNKEEYQRVILDAENYRTKREKTLEQLAHRLAGKVIRTGRTQKLEPMNPYERKIIHTALQDDSRVTTRSEGKDPYRRVIVELK
ncbi:MAG: protein jag [Clostridiales bacterium]|nr:protein jag [Clostridiales bacterium]MDY6116561.1 RNA-binding cell elongation regulator Jag/EloR [Anaerovoracaceae bacterium]